MESRRDTGRLIQPANANGQHVSVAHIEIHAPLDPTRGSCLDNGFPGLCDPFATEQSDGGSWDMNERKYRYSSLLAAVVAVEATSIEHPH